MSVKEVSLVLRIAGVVVVGGALSTLHRAIQPVIDPALRVPKQARQAITRMARISWSQQQDFVQIRMLELFEGLQLEHDDDYALAMASALAGSDGRRTREYLLRQDVALREEVFWRLFEVEGGGEVSLTNLDKYSAVEDCWDRTVLTLVAEGVLDRSRVLRSSLAALGRDFASYPAGWFSRLWNALQPSAAEAATEQPLLRHLLASPVTATVSLAVTHLSAVHRAGLLETAGFVRDCAPALAGGKATALGVLKILAAAADDAALGDDPLAAAANALQHPSPEVQRVAVKLLLRHDRAALLDAAAAELLSPSVAVELGLRSTVVAAEPWAAAATADAESAHAPRAAVAVDPWPEHEAIERIAVMLERAEDPIELEQALAWFAAGPRRDALAPLQARARARVASSDGGFVASLVLVALGINPTAASWQPEPVLPILRGRIAEVFGMLEAGTGQRLLATPTDRTGWVAPEALVARFHEIAAAGALPLQLDLVAALLRLGQEHRHAALAQLGQLRSLPKQLQDAAAAISYALGGAEPRRIGAHPLWIAAGRARNPNTTDPVLHRAGQRLTGQSAPSAIQIAWQSTTHRYREYRGGKELQVTSWTARSVASRRNAARATEPTVLPSRALNYSLDDQRLPVVELRQLGLVHPPSTLTLIETGIDLLHWGLREHSAVGEEHILTALAEHPGRWEPVTAELVALGLSNGRAQVRAQAAELLAAAVPTRIDAATFAAGMAHSAGPCTLTRWAQSLSDAAGISASSGPTVVAILTFLLPTLDRGRTGIGALLTLLLDESLRAGTPSNDATLRAWLGEFAGNSAAAKTARRLLSLCEPQ